MDGANARFGTRRFAALLHQLGTGLHHLVTGSHGPDLFRAAVIVLILILLSHRKARG